MNQEQKAENQRKCGENRRLRFNGAIAKDDIEKFSGKDVLYLDLLFSEGIRFRMFSPRESADKRRQLYESLGSLCAALGKDWNNIPGCFMWEDFALTYAQFLDECKGKTIHVKITLNSGGYPTYGSGKCFSEHPDMEYSDEDWLYLDEVPEESKQSKMFGAPKEPWEKDLPF